MTAAVAHARARQRARRTQLSGGEAGGASARANPNAAARAARASARHTRTTAALSRGCRTRCRLMLSGGALGCREGHKKKLRYVVRQSLAQRGARPELLCAGEARAAGGATRSHAEACGVAALVAGEQGHDRRVRSGALLRLRLALTRALRRCCQSLRTTWASGTRRLQSSSSRSQKGRQRRQRSMLRSWPTAQSFRSTFAARC